MRTLHYFNPGHEAAVCNGSPTYMPPAPVARMQRDLAFLPAWYAHPDDFVLTETPVAAGFLQTLHACFGTFPRPLTRSEIAGTGRGLPAAAADPWGVSPQSQHLFQRLRDESGWNLTVPVYDDTYARLCSRQTAAVCLSALLPALPQPDRTLIPRFRRTPEEIEAILNADPQPYLIKAPYSCAGRGVRTAKEKLSEADKQWIGGIVRKQGCIGLEPLRDKRFDLAMEFYSDGKGNIHYEGLSVFTVTPHGSYTGNTVAPQEELKRRIETAVGKDMPEISYLPEEIKENLSTVLQDTAGHLYRGYLGVDMLIYADRSGALRFHPCVEINWRRSMGWLAIELNRRFLAPGSHGKLLIEAHPAAGKALRLHNERQQALPLRTAGGRLVSGYCSLCPVGNDTRYLAYLLAEEIQPLPLIP